MKLTKVFEGACKIANFRQLKLIVFGMHSGPYCALFHPFLCLVINYFEGIRGRFCDHFLSRLF